MIALIVAADLNGGIGHKGKIPWHIPEDLAYFKHVTLNHTVIMGNTTFKSIGVPLPSRRNIVVSSKNHAKIAKHKKTGREYQRCRSFASALEAAKDDPVVFIIGGESIYNQALELGIIDLYYLTRVFGEYETDRSVMLPEVCDFSLKSYHSVYHKADGDMHYRHELWVANK